MNQISTQAVIDAMESLLSAPAVAPVLMSESQAAPTKHLFVADDPHAAGGPYRRLYRYVKPYRWRFIARASPAAALRRDRLALPARPRAGDRRYLPGGAPAIATKPIALANTGAPERGPED